MVDKALFRTMSAEFLRMQEMKVLRRGDSLQQLKDGASLERVPRINHARKATQTWYEEVIRNKYEKRGTAS